jgi:hypothetical protein
MGKATRAICGLAFLLKAAIAVIIGIALLGFQVYKVYDLFKNAPKRLPPVLIPALGSAEALRCFHQSKTARLEPPPGVFFWGFSLQWDVDTPQQLRERMGINPALIKFAIVNLVPLFT